MTFAVEVGCSDALPAGCSAVAGDAKLQHDTVVRHRVNERVGPPAAQRRYRCGGLRAMHCRQTNPRLRDAIGQCPRDPLELEQSHRLPLPERSGPSPHVGRNRKWHTARWAGTATSVGTAPGTGPPGPRTVRRSRWSTTPARKQLQGPNRWGSYWQPGPPCPPRNSAGKYVLERVI